MKFLLALLMLLTFASCTAEEVPVYDQEHIDVTLEPEALYTAMNERGVVGIHETGNAVYSSCFARSSASSAAKSGGAGLLPSVYKRQGTATVMKIPVSTAQISISGTRIRYRLYCRRILCKEFNMGYIGYLPQSCLISLIGV